MSPVVTPELADEESTTAIDAMLVDLQQPSPKSSVTPTRRRRLRDLLSPKANGDQDSW